MKLKTIAKFLGAGLLSMSSAYGQFDDEAPSWVTIDSLTVNGNGCPIGTVGENISHDRKAFTLTFSDYIAEAGWGISLRESRKACQVIVDLRYPAGWSYSVISFDYRGFADLDDGVSATQKVDYYFQGFSQTASLRTTLEGPYSDDYHFTDRFRLDAMVWSSCSATRAINLKTSLRVNNRRGGGSGIMTLDSLDGNVSHEYGLVWRRCN